MSATQNQTFWSVKLSGPEKVKVKVKVTQLYPALCNPMDYTALNSPGQNPGVDGPFPSQGDLPNPGLKLRSPALQADSLPAEPPGKPKNTVVGSQFLLQWIFLTQELNWGHLLCRKIIYQLTYYGSWLYE